MFNGRSMRVFLFLAIAIIISGCSASDYRFKGAVPAVFFKDGKPIYRLKINNPSLSHDGKLMAFDFNEIGLIKNRFVERNFGIGIYDFETDSLKVLDIPDLPSPPGPSWGWHSPSFDTTGKYLAVVTHCVNQLQNDGVEKKCPPGYRGHQIGVLDLLTNKFVRLTDSRQKIPTWKRSNVSPYGFRLSRSSGSTLLRKSPVFSGNLDRVYYFADNTHFRYVDLSNPPINYDTDDRLLQTAGDDLLLYSSLGGVNHKSISLIDDKKLLIAAYKVRGNKGKQYMAKEPAVIIYDTVSNEVSIPITRADVVKLQDDNSYVESVTASKDGKRIAVIRGKRDTVSVYENGKFRDLVTAQELGLNSIQYKAHKKINAIAISGDGSKLAVLPPYVFVDKEVDVFWVVDVDTGKRQALDLRNRLRKAHTWYVNTSN